MSVSSYAVKNGRNWRFVITRRTVTGKRDDICKGGFKSKEEARLAEAEFREDLKDNTVLNQYSTLNDVYEYWIERVKIKGAKQKTIETYENRYNSVFKKPLGKKKISKINSFILQKFINEITPDYVSLNNYILVISSIFKLAVDFNIIDKNPCHTIIVDESKLKEKVEKKEVLNYKELKNFGKGLNKWLVSRKKMKDERIVMDKALITLFSATGMRVSELLALEWDDIDFENKTIAITKTQSEVRSGIIVTPPKTKSSIRKIPLTSDKLLDLLLEWKEKQQILREKFNNSNSEVRDVIFYNIAQDKRFTSQTVVKKIEEVLNFCKCERFTSHILRHTFTSIMRENGVAKEKISHYIGHEINDKNMTDRYTHFSVEYLLDVSKMAEKLIVPLFF